MDSGSDEGRSDPRPEKRRAVSDPQATAEPASRSRYPSDPEGDPIEEDPAESSGPIPDIVRKALAMGLTGFFSTEQTIRKAVGDTLPQEWIDFVAGQSERTRSDFTDAIAAEFGRSLKTIDLTKMADQLLTGRTLDVSARIRLLPLEEDESAGAGSDS
jgi:hypothetical protein